MTLRPRLVVLWLVLVLAAYPPAGSAQPSPPGSPSPGPADSPGPPGSPPGPKGGDFPPGDPQYGERSTLVREGTSGIVDSLVCIARGALLTEDFAGGDVDFQTWRLMPFINREWVSVKEGALSIAGRLQRPQRNILFMNSAGGLVHLGLVSRRFPTADVVAVARMRAVSLPATQDGEWSSVFHLCSSVPDYFSEIRFGSLREGGLGWSFASQDERQSMSRALPAFGDESASFYTVKVERDGPARVMTGYVEGANGWVKLGEAANTNLFTARLELKIVGHTDGADLDTRFDDVRLYPHPDRTPVRFVLTAAFPTFSYPAAGAESLALKLYEADGTTLIGEGRRATDGAFDVTLSRELTFPIGAVVRLLHNGKEVGAARITAKGVEGLYPGDVWGVNL